MKDKNKPKPTRYWVTHCKRMNAAKKSLASFPFANLKGNGAMGIANRPELARIIKQSGREVAP